MTECRKCHKSIHEVGGYFQRMNETGVPGVWECRPTCDSDFPYTSVWRWRWKRTKETSRE